MSCWGGSSDQPSSTEDGTDESAFVDSVIRTTDVQGTDAFPIRGGVDTGSSPTETLDTNNVTEDVDASQEDVHEAPADVASSIVLPEGLNGSVVEEAVFPPDFVSVVDQDGQAVSPSDLIGTPTVLWFFPMPSTPG